MSKKTETEKEINHPLEEVFNIEESTTVVPYVEVKTDLVPYEPFDVKDEEIEQQLQDLYDMALEAFENQQVDADTIEPKYKARNAEVAVQYLRAALDAAREKRQLKEHKDKVTVKEKGAGTINNNLVVSHSEMLDLVEEVNKRKPIDGEFEETET
ncbi:MAG: hypothetical protein ACXADH_03855 [Candidatus Kariarchaeaceae archaeon]|jgi:hypothetical protein